MQVRRPQHRPTTFRVYGLVCIGLILILRFFFLSESSESLSQSSIQLSHGEVAFRGSVGAVRKKLPHEDDSDDSDDDASTADKSNDDPAQYALSSQDDDVEEKTADDPALVDDRAGIDDD